MNSEKKVVLQEACLQALQEKINALEAERAILVEREKALKDKLSAYDGIISEIEAERTHYIESIAEISEIKNGYRQALRSVCLIRKNYEAALKRLLGE